MLDEIGAGKKLVITALNKIDKVSDLAIIDKARVFFNNPVAISALKREGFDGLIEAIRNLKTA